MGGKRGLGGTFVGLIRNHSAASKINAPRLLSWADVMNKLFSIRLLDHEDASLSFATVCSSQVVAPPPQSLSDSERETETTSQVKRFFSTPLKSKEKLSFS